MSLDTITSRIREDSRADFAFILTRKGRLLTREAPPQMPEVGRTACVEAAREAGAMGVSLVELTLPREHLVPFGGAAPVDVFVSPCGEAIVCIVLATWTDAGSVGPALEASLPELEALVASAKAERAGRRPGRTVAPPAPVPPGVAPPQVRTTPLPAGQAARPPRETAPSSRPGRAAKAAPSSRTRAPRPSELPPSRAPIHKGPAAGATAGSAAGSGRGSGKPPSVASRPLSGLVELSKGAIRASGQLQSAPSIVVRGDHPPMRGPLSSEVPLGGRGSLPHIEVHEAPLGRESLAAIEADGHARGSLPHIEVHEALLGRETIAAIDEDLASDDGDILIGEAMLGSESLVAIEEEARGALARSRVTHPWSALSSSDAQSAEPGRLIAPPAPAVGTLRPVAAPPAASLPSSSASRRKKQNNSNVDLWHEALGEMIEGDSSASASASAFASGGAVPGGGERDR